MSDSVFNQISSPSIQKFGDQIIQQINPILSIHQELQLNQEKLVQQDNHYESNSKPFTYDLIQNHSIQQNEYCYAIAFNSDNSIILAGCYSKIKIFEFKQEQLKLIQILSEHQNNVSTLNFMKKQTQFVSGGWDKLIIIWSMNQNNQWICTQKLNEHKYWINCLIQNNNEDLIISGSQDTTIKFWIKQNHWVCSQTITDHKQQVLGLYLNEKQNRVISCGQDSLILIEESFQKWNIIQIITLEVWGIRLCSQMIIYSHFNLFVKNRCMFMRLIAVIISTQKQKKFLLNAILSHAIPIHAIIFFLNNISNLNV